MPKRFLLSFLCGGLLLSAAAARAESMVLPDVKFGPVGPLSIEGYGNRTVFMWESQTGPGRSTTATFMELPVPFYGLVAGLAVGIVLIGGLAFLRRRQASA